MITVESYMNNQADLILKDISQKTGIPINVITSSRRSDNLVSARKKAAVQMRNCGMTLVDIGKSLNRNHASIVHLLNNRKDDGIRHRKGQEQPIKNVKKRCGFLDSLKEERHELQKRIDAMDKLISLYETK